MEQRVILSKHFESDLALAISECEHDGIFVICDTSSHRYCWSKIAQFPTLRQAEVIMLVDGDANKNLRQLTRVWERLQKGGANRHSLVINLGGGMVTDLGGFAAATFKRGLSFINVPTTLLAMIDASVGGKTGVNFGGMKNEIGTFKEATRVIINPCWLKSQDSDNLRSGYAEMLKHGLLDTRAHWAELINFNLSQPDWHRLATMIGENIAIKARFIDQDPYEKDIRKALNLGHTFGHAIEEWSLGRKALLHGHAVAFGLVCELYLSTVREGFPADTMRQTVDFIRSYYGTPPITCDDYAELTTLMHHDKKSHHGHINTVLLGDIGKPIVDQVISDEEAHEALDFLREGA